jgi:hypothetical protein
VKSKYKVAIPTVVLLAILAAFWAGYTVKQVEYITVTVQKAPIVGYVRIWVRRSYDSDFELIDEGENRVMDQGLKLIRNAWGFNNLSSTDGWMNVTGVSLCNEASVPSNTSAVLVSEITSNGLDRAKPDSVTVINATCYNVTHTFTATGTQAVQQAGLNWNYTDNANSLVCARTFSSTTLYADDQLKVEWLIVFISGT